MRASACSSQSDSLPVHYIVAIHAALYNFYWPFVSGKESRVPRIYHPFTALCYKKRDKDFSPSYFKSKFGVSRSRDLVADGPWKNEFYGTVRHMVGPLISFKIGWFYAAMDAIAI